MSEPNDRLERTYRSLAREEPPASLDAAILAAARRAVARPSLARRWGVPVSIAALLMLAVGVTLEMQHEEPGIELPARSEGAGVSTQGTAAPQAQMPRPMPPEAQEEPRSNAPSRAREEPALAAPSAEPEAKRASPAARAESRRKDAPKAAPEAPPAREIPRPFAAPAPIEPRSPPVQAAPAPRREPPAAAAPAPATAASGASVAAPSAAEQRFAAPAANMAKRSAAAGATADTMAAPTDPRAELEKIAKLREAGRDAEADRALEEFRKRYPEYRIDDAMWQRVKPR